eukprot:768749-Hanusia_phi.AAC.15
MGGGTCNVLWGSEGYKGGVGWLISATHEELTCTDGHKGEMQPLLRDETVNAAGCPLLAQSPLPCILRPLK